jgi:hypothetical protein
MQEAGNLSTSGIRDVFAATALDIEAPGFDNDSGVGIVDALTAVGTVTDLGSCGCGTGTQVCAEHLILNDKPNQPAIPGTINQTLRACHFLGFESGDISGVRGIAPSIAISNTVELGDATILSTLD